MNKEILTKVIRIERNDMLNTSQLECPNCRKVIGGSFKQTKCPHCNQNILWK